MFTISQKMFMYMYMYHTSLIIYAHFIFDCKHDFTHSLKVVWCFLPKFLDNYNVHVAIFWLQIELSTDHKLYKDQNNRQAFSKTFWLSFYNLRLPFHPYMKTQLVLFCLKAVIVKSYLEMKYYSNTCSDYYNIASSKLSLFFELHLFHFVHVQNCWY